MAISDREFILTPSVWPLASLLPVTRKESLGVGSGQDCGIIWAGDIARGKFVVYVANLYLLTVPLAVLTKIQYADVDVLLETWRID